MESNTLNSKLTHGLLSNMLFSAGLVVQPMSVSISYICVCVSIHILCMDVCKLGVESGG